MVAPHRADILLQKKLQIRQEELFSKRPALFRALPRSAQNQLERLGKRNSIEDVVEAGTALGHHVLRQTLQPHLATGDGRARCRHHEEQ